MKMFCQGNYAVKTVHNQPNYVTTTLFLLLLYCLFTFFGDTEKPAEKLYSN